MDPLIERREHQAHKDSDLFAFKGTYRGARLPANLLPVLAFPGGYGGMVIGDHEQLTLAFCIRRDALRACRERNAGLSAALAAQAHVASTCAGVRDALTDATLVAPWLTVGPIRPSLRSPWRGDGIFAIGNAAGEAHPILGEGISMAIQSGWMLCELLIPRRDALMAGQRADKIGRCYKKNGVAASAFVSASPHCWRIWPCALASPHRCSDCCGAGLEYSPPARDSARKCIG